MGVRRTAGFTIIESMLFLAITGVLIIGIMAGAGASLNSQRYKDAVETFKNVLQQQYADLGSVYNGRSNTWSCDASARPTEDGQEIRGQSDCLIVGRYMRIVESDIQIYTVLARPLGVIGPAANDITALRTNYAYNISTAEVQQKSLEWSTKIAWPVSGAGSDRKGARSMGMLVVRSPNSGSMYTFTSDTVPASTGDISSQTFTDMMVATTTIPGRAQRTLCVQSGGLSALTGGDMAVTISANASSASAIEVRSNPFMLETMGSNAPQC